MLDGRDDRGLAWRTRLAQPGDLAPAGFRSLVPPVHRGSTTLFPDAASVRDTWDHHQAAYTYGQYGTPTTLELAARIADLEHGSVDVPDARRPVGAVARRPRVPQRRRPRAAAGERLRPESRTRGRLAGDASASRPRTTRRWPGPRSATTFGRPRSSCGPRVRAPTRWRCRTSRRSPRPRTRTARSSRSTTRGRPGCCSTRSPTGSTSPSRRSRSTSAVTATCSSGRSRSRIRGRTSAWVKRSTSSGSSSRPTTARSRSVGSRRWRCGSRPSSVGTGDRPLARRAAGDRARPPSRAARVSRPRVLEARLHGFQRHVLDRPCVAVRPRACPPVRRFLAPVPDRLQLGRRH